MRETLRSLAVQGRHFVPFMLNRLIALYEDWRRPAEAAVYRARRLEWEREPAVE